LGKKESLVDNYSRPIIVSTGGLVEDEAMGVVYW
jgi:hypothetical protein